VTGQLKKLPSFVAYCKLLKKKLTTI